MTRSLHSTTPNRMASPIIFFLTVLSVNMFAADVYLETNRQLIIEVEAAPATEKWKVETSLPGFTGKCYYTWTGLNYFRSPGHGVLEYRFYIQHPGVYNFRIHNRHDHPKSSEANDVFTKLDDGKWVKTYSSKRGEWTWKTAHEFSHKKKCPAKYELTAGLHTLYIAARSKGFSIDRIVFYQNGADATDTSLPVSPLYNGEARLNQTVPSKSNEIQDRPMALKATPVLASDNRSFNLPSKDNSNREIEKPIKNRYWLLEREYDRQDEGITLLQPGNTLQKTTFLSLVSHRLLWDGNF